MIGVTEITDMFGQVQGIYPALKRLCWDNVRNSWPISSQDYFLSRSPSLEFLDMGLVGLHCMDVVSALISVLEQGCLPRLHSLGLKNRVKDDALSPCIRAMSRINYLDCSWSHFGPQAYRSLIPHFGTLQTLRLNRRVHVDSDTTQTVHESCHGLVEWLC